MNALIDYKEKVKSLCDRSVAVLSKADMTEESAQLKQITDEILAKTSPSMMFYGVYNAGKSSIINAVFGEDIAAIGDVPTTRETQTIEWNNFKIVDTPGINANNEHTLVARNELSKSDVVLFVIADENIEEKSFYSAFIDVLKKDIQTVLVINQKNANYSLTDSEEIHELTKRVIELIGIASRSAGISVDISRNKNFHGIIPINAEVARNSQKIADDDSKLMYEYSNLDELIDTMQRILNSSGGVKMLRPAINATEDALLTSSEKIRASIKSASEKNYFNTIDNIKRQKESLHQRLITEGRICISRYRSTLLSYAGENNIPTPDISSINDELNNILVRGFRDADINLQSQFDLYNVDLYGSNLEKRDFFLNIPKFEISNSEFDYFDNNNSDIIKSVVETAAEIGEAVSSGEIPNPKPIIKAIPLIVDVLVKIVKSKKQREEEQRRKQEEMIRECNRRNSEIETQINERMAIMLELNRKINSEMDKLERSYKSTVSQNIEQAYAPLLKTLETQFTQLQQSAENTKVLISDIDSVISELGLLKTAISD